MSTRQLVALVLALQVAAIVTAAELYAASRHGLAVNAVLDFTVILGLLAAGYRAGMSHDDDE